MAETPKRPLQSPRKYKQLADPQPSPLPPSSCLSPQTPQTLPSLRRSLRRASLQFNASAVPKSTSSVENHIKDSSIFRPSGCNYEISDPNTPGKPVQESGKDLGRTQKRTSNRESTKPPKLPKTPKSRVGTRNQQDLKSPNLGGNYGGPVEVEVTFSPLSPDQLEAKKRKRGEEGSVVRRTIATRNAKLESKKNKKRVYYKKVVYDGGEFEVGDDVYLKRREDASSDEEDPEVEECRICFKAGNSVMIECDDCLGGFHLKCLKPKLKEVPEGVWTCGFCEARKLGKEVEFPKPPEGKKRFRTLREKLLSSDLWAARIERFDYL